MSIDDQSGEQHSPPEPVAKSASRKETGIRILYVLLFTIIYGLGELVFGAVVVVQFGFKLITHQTNARLLRFSTSLNRFLYDILQYMTFNSDIRPFPFAEWPSQEEAD